jgi:hypothetical protein
MLLRKLSSQLNIITDWINAGCQTAMLMLDATVGDKKSVLLAENYADGSVTVWFEKGKCETIKLQYAKELNFPYVPTPYVVSENVVGQEYRDMFCEYFDNDSDQMENYTQRMYCDKTEYILSDGTVQYGYSPTRSRY